MGRQAEPLLQWQQSERKRAFPGDASWPALRPIEASKAAVGYVRNTSATAVRRARNNGRSPPGGNGSERLNSSVRSGGWPRLSQ